MRAVTDLNDTSETRCPAGLRISPKKLEVDDSVVGCAANEVLEDGRPFTWAWDLVETYEHLFLVDGVVP